MQIYSVRCLQRTGLLLVLLILPLLGKAQRFRASLEGGINLSQIDGDRLSGYNQPGLAGGLQVNAVLSERWELSTGMSFTQQGARRNLNDDPAAAFDRIRLNLVEVPAMIQFNEWKFQIGAGLAYGRLISSKLIDVFGDDVSASLPLRPNQFSAVLGGTVFFSEHAGLAVRWSKNLHDIQETGAANRWIGRNIAIRGVYRF